MKLSMKIAFLFFCLLSSNLFAVTFNVDDRGDSIVINLTGEIEPGDYTDFKKILKKHPTQKIYIVLKSNGGDFDVALKIAAKIAARNKKGIIVDTSTLYCQSACFFIAAAGKERHVLYSKNVLGVHFPYRKDGKVLSKKLYNQLYKKQIKTLRQSGFSKHQADAVVKKSLQGTSKKTIKFSRKELTALGFILI